MWLISRFYFHLIFTCSNQRPQKKSHCVKSIQILSFFWYVFSRIRTEYGPKKTPYLDTFHAVREI